jgi:ferredoxin--NADP+ reductase
MIVVGLPASSRIRPDGKFAMEIQRAIPSNLFKSTNALLGQVLKNRRLTPPERPPPNDVRHIVLSSLGLSYLPGQSIGVIPEGYDLTSGKPHKLRLYSVSSEAKGDYGDWKTVSTVVVRHFWGNEKTGETSIPGVCSKQLCDCDVGDVVRITGPVGKRFLLPTDFHKRDLIFVATGTGIAPYRGMLKEMFDEDYSGKVFLIFGAQYADTVLYDDEFRSYLDRANFRYITALSREAEKNPFPDEVPTPGNKMYVQVRMWQHRQEIRESLEKPDTIVYQCGLKGLEQGVFQVIDKIGDQMGELDLSKRLQSEGRMLLEVY